MPAALMDSVLANGFFRAAAGERRLARLQTLQGFWIGEGPFPRARVPVGAGIRDVESAPFEALSGSGNAEASCPCSAFAGPGPDDWPISTSKIEATNTAARTAGEAQVGKRAA